MRSGIVYGTAAMLDGIIDRIRGEFPGKELHIVATGGSALSAIHYLREQGVCDIRFLVLVAAPEGVRAVLQEDPDVRIWTCALDDGLNEQAYILPGLGDAGDRIFGTL